MTLPYKNLFYFLITLFLSLQVNLIFIQQTLFSPNKLFRPISLNTSIHIIFKAPRDQKSFGILSRQFEESRWRTMVKIFKDATSRPNGYLFLDWSQNTPDSLRYRTNVFNLPHEPLIIYMLDEEKK